MHGVNYMKDRELGSAVFTVPLLLRHQGSFVTSSQPSPIHIHNAWCLLHKRQGGRVSSVYHTFASAASRRVSMRWASSRMTESTNGGFAWKLPHVGSVRKRHTQQDSYIRSTPTISTHTVWRFLLEALVCKHSGTGRGQGRVCIRHIAPLFLTIIWLFCKRNGVVHQKWCCFSRVYLCAAVRSQRTSHGASVAGSSSMHANCQD